MTKSRPALTLSCLIPALPQAAPALAQGMRTFRGMGLMIARAAIEGFAWRRD